jgi:hypothetical protein
MRSTSQHFNVGYGTIDASLGVPRILDRKPFEKFESKAR